MNIKNKLYMSAGISIVLVAILFSLVLVTSGRVAEGNKKHQLLMDVHGSIAELDIVTYDYLLHREERMEQQWISKYNSLKQILDEAAEEQELISIRADFAALGNLFSEISANNKRIQKLIQVGASQEEIDAAIGLEERCVAQLLIKSHSVITDASRLAEEAQAEVMGAQRLAANLTLILMTILAITVTTLSLLVARSISKPLDKLTKGAEIVGKGHLEHKVDIKSRDELGELADAFNKMTGNLLGNITARKWAEEELRKHRDHLEESVKERTKELRDAREYAENTVATVREPLVVLDADLRVVSVNRSFYQTFKVNPKETEGQLIYELGNRQWDIPRLRELLEEILPKNTSFDNFEIEHNFETIGRRVMLLNARRIYREANRTQMILLAIEDITELKEMQEKLVRSEKLVVLGQLAGGVGHELRNPLGVIKNAAYFLNMALEEPEPEVKETLELLDKEVATSERIITSLLDFTRPKSPTRQKVDINDVIQAALARTTIPENIKVVNQLDGSLPVILADPDQLVQVFGNITLNAIQAMPEGGQLVINSEAPSPQWVAISFTDTGAGIPKENLNKLFEPLFTTKSKGIGLGLAVTNTLVKGHGGTIEVQSEVGKGSTFTVKLPLSAKEEK